MTNDEYLEVNRTNWDSRAPVHAKGYGIERFLEDPAHISSVVAFDRPRLGDVAGIGAICWLPSIRRWAQTVAQLLRPGGRLFIRDGHPVLLSTLAMSVGAEHDDRQQQPWITAPGALTPALELPYFEQPEPLVWEDEHSYSGSDKVAQPRSMEWNHGLGEIVMAVLDAGLELTSLTGHDSTPWDALPGLMVLDEEIGEYRLRDRPERLPTTFTLTARRR